MALYSFGVAKCSSAIKLYIAVHISRDFYFITNSCNINFFWLGLIATYSSLIG